MTDHALRLKKRILSRVVRTDDPDLLQVVDLLLAHADAPCGPQARDAILGEVARVLRGAAGRCN